jgi:nitroreductase
LELARLRRSVRWFLPKPVPRELIERAMRVAREAPSACNRQPFVFRAFDEPNRVRELAEVPMGAAGYAHQIPLLIVVVGQQRHFFDPRDRHLIYIDGALAGMSFILALETLGLSSCILNWPDIAEREEAMRRALDLAADERPVFLIAVGYPDPEGLVARSVKRPISELLHFE